MKDGDNNQSLAQPQDLTELGKVNLTDMNMTLFAFVSDSTGYLHPDDKKMNKHVKIRAI